MAAGSLFSMSILTQILPVAIGRFDQCDLLTAQPAFDLLFAMDRAPDIPENFVMHQASDVISRGETRNELPSMLEDSSLQVVGDAGIQGPRWASHDVHVVGFIRADPHHSLCGTAPPVILSEAKDLALALLLPSPRSGARFLATLSHGKHSCRCSDPPSRSVADSTPTRPSI